jgi:predicted regulator of Ras-like GTPase activity (Roadblock/LC7/MglB family)
MPTIRDLVGAIRQRDGVEAAIVLGRDGLLIDSQAAPGVDVESAAAHVPSILAACDEFGDAAARGALRTAVVEHERGLSIVSAISGDAVLLVLVSAGANVGQLMYDVRRHREQIASLV